MTVHPHATLFSELAEEYERGRPGYPRPLLDWLTARGDLDSGSTVVDLGAGTGKLTRLLVEGAARVIGVEPIEGMRDEFARILPDTELLDASAEAMPLKDGSVDVVACGQSFRWFATEAALDEIARVLRDSGELVLVFNSYETSTPLQQRLEEVQRAARVETVEDKPGSNWREVLLSSPHFELVEEATFPNSQVLERASVIDRLHSSSQFTRLPVERQEELIAELMTLIPGEVVELALSTSVTALRRRSRS